MSFIKVKDNPHLVRDSKSKAIINTNINALKGYRRQREERKKIKEMIENHEKIKNELAEVKDTLQLILQKLS